MISFLTLPPLIIACSVLVQQNEVCFVEEDATAVVILLGLMSSHARLRRQLSVSSSQRH